MSKLWEDDISWTEVDLGLSVAWTAKRRGEERYGSWLSRGVRIEGSMLN
jgi:hypothetical protein